MPAHKNTARTRKRSQECAKLSQAHNFSIMWMRGEKLNREREKWTQAHKAQSVMKTERSHDCQVKVVFVTDVPLVAHFLFLLIFSADSHSRICYWSRRTSPTVRTTDKSSHPCWNIMFTHKPLLPSLILDAHIHGWHHKWDLNNKTQNLYRSSESKRRTNGV